MAGFAHIEVRPNGDVVLVDTGSGVSGGGTSTGSGTVNESDLSFSDVTTENATTSRHGLLRKLSGDATEYLDGTGNWTVPSTGISGVSEANISLSDVTTDNASTSGHGFLPKLSGVSGTYLNGMGQWAVIVGLTEAEFSLADVTIADASTTKHGFLRKLSGNSTDFLNGLGQWATVISGVSEALISLSDVTTDDVNTSRHGFAPKAPNDTTKFLRGDGTWAVVGATGVSSLVSDTLWDNKGDLVVGVTNNTAVILPVGTDGQVLIADSTQTDGVKWGTTSDWSSISKASDESVTSSTTLQNDDDFFFTATSGAVYQIEFIVIYGSPVGNTTPNIKFAFGEDATTRGLMTVATFFSTGGSATGVTTTGIGTNQTSNLAIQTATADRVARFHGWHIGNGGTFRVLWAQNTSNGNATIVRANSKFYYRRIN